jgi:hypothetical protein
MLVVISLGIGLLGVLGVHTTDVITFLLIEDLSLLAPAL